MIHNFDSSMTHLSWNLNRKLVVSNVATTVSDYPYRAATAYQSQGMGLLHFRPPEATVQSNIAPLAQSLRLPSSLSQGLVRSMSSD